MREKHETLQTDGNIEGVAKVHPRLSILIPGLPHRKEVRENLLAGLIPQCGDEMYRESADIAHCVMERIIFEHVEILTLIDDKQHSTGAKRNMLIDLANGEYIAFIDDDDQVSEHYVFAILKALKTSPDCVGFQGWITTDGIKRIDWELSKDLPDRTVVRHGRTFYERRTNHLCPVRREIALQAGFPDKSNAEDKAYAEKLNPLLKTEVKISDLLYHYKESRKKEY